MRFRKKRCEIFWNRKAVEESREFILYRAWTGLKEQTQNANMEDTMQVEIIKSNRKTIEIQICSDGHIRVRVPHQMTDAEIGDFLRKKSKWIEKHLGIVKKELEERAKEEPIQKLSLEELQELADQALNVIPKKVRYYAEKVGVDYGRITIRNQKTRWGSCSAKGNLNFNCLLMLAPEEVQNYVVIHELCHRKEMNHSSDFWAEVEAIMPDYKKYRGWLKENGEGIMKRMLG